jgi:Ca2+-transporting ATPase
VYGLRTYPDNLADAQTVAFATLIVSELLRAYTARSERYPLLSIGLFGNKWMQYAVGSSFVLLLAVIYVPFLQPFFGTIPLTLQDWIVMTPLFTVSSVAAEITKAVLRWRAARSTREAALA